MHALYILESSFFRYAFLMQLCFSIITFFISYLAFRIYQITENQKTKNMAIAFLFIFMSYAVQLFFNSLVALRIDHDLYVLMGIHPLSVFENIGLQMHFILMALGLAILTYAILKNSDLSLLWYFVLSSLLVVFLARNLMLGFFLLSSLYLGVLSYYFFKNYLKQKKRGPFLIASAFFSMLVGNICFIFLANSGHFYALGHIFDFIGYSLLIYNYYTIRK